MTGNERSGVTVTVSSSVKVLIRVRHISRGRPLLSAVHEAHLPALQFHPMRRPPAWACCGVAWLAAFEVLPAGVAAGVGPLQAVYDVEHVLALVDLHGIGLRDPAGG